MASESLLSCTQYSSSVTFRCLEKRTRSRASSITCKCRSFHSTDGRIGLVLVNDQANQATVIAERPESHVKPPRTFYYCSQELQCPVQDIYCGTTGTNSPPSSVGVVNRSRIRKPRNTPYTRNKDINEGTVVAISFHKNCHDTGPNIRSQEGQGIHNASHLQYPPT